VLLVAGEDVGPSHVRLKRRQIEVATGTAGARGQSVRSTLLRACGAARMRAGRGAALSLWSVELGLARDELTVADVMPDARKRDERPERHEPEGQRDIYGDGAHLDPSQGDSCGDEAEECGKAREEHREPTLPQVVNRELQALALRPHQRQLVTEDDEARAHHHDIHGAHDGERERDEKDGGYDVRRVLRHLEVHNALEREARQERTLAYQRAVPLNVEIQLGLADAERRALGARLPNLPAAGVTSSRVSTP